jgi:hypothetical protein
MVRLNKNKTLFATPFFLSARAPEHSRHCSVSGATSKPFATVNFISAAVIHRSPNSAKPSLGIVASRSTVLFRLMMFFRDYWRPELPRRIYRKPNGFAAKSVTWHLRNKPGFGRR